MKQRQRASKAEWDGVLRAMDINGATGLVEQGYLRHGEQGLERHTKLVTGARHRLRRQPHARRERTKASDTGAMAQRC